DGTYVQDASSITRTPLSTPDPPISLPTPSVAVFLAILDILATVGDIVSPAAATPSFSWQYFVVEMRWSLSLVRSHLAMRCPRGESLLRRPGTLGIPRTIPRRQTRPGSPDALVANGFGPNAGRQSRQSVGTGTKDGLWAG